MNNIVEYALSTSSDDAQVLCWDLRTLNVVSSFKANPKCGKNGLALCGPNLLVASQQNKAAMRIYAWGKDQPVQRFSGPERIPIVTCSPDGNVIVGGSDSGTLYIWQASSGRLLRFFTAHFKAVTVLKFTADGMTLVSAGGDGVVQVWSVVSLLDPTAGAPKPTYTWSSHSLPVTAIHVGSGMSSSCRVLTVSLDRTAKLWDMASGKVLCTLVFPAGLTSCVMDPAEFIMCVGGSDGYIYKAEMFQLNISESKGSSIDTASSRHTFLSHTAEVTSLELSYDCNLLVSGSLDGTVVVWDLTSSEKLRTFRLHEGPITNLSLILRPRSVFNNTIVQKDLPPLDRYLSQGPVLDGVQLSTTATCPPQPPSSDIAIDGALIREEIEERTCVAVDESQRDRLHACEQDLLAAKADLERARGLNDQLYERLSKSIRQ